LKNLRNKDTTGNDFSANQIQAAWEKGIPITGYDRNMYRHDSCGSIIKRDMFGMINTPLNMGWEIDHIKPKNRGGGDEPDNLQPLQWENNRGKGDNYPKWECSVTSSHQQNVYR
jgi:hypothetical protein